MAFANEVVAKTTEEPITQSYGSQKPERNQKLLIQSTTNRTAQFSSTCLGTLTLEKPSDAELIIGTKFDLWKISSAEWKKVHTEEIIQFTASHQPGSIDKRKNQSHTESGGFAY